MNFVRLIEPTGIAFTGGLKYPLPISYSASWIQYENKDEKTLFYMITRKDCLFKALMEICNIDTLYSSLNNINNVKCALSFTDNSFYKAICDLERIRDKSGCTEKFTLKIKIDYKKRKIVKETYNKFDILDLDT